MESPTKKSFLESLTIGAVSGTLSSVILQPLDMVKTRQQLIPRLNMFQHSKLILRHEGVLAFWKGLVPTLARTVPGVGVYFSSLRGLQSSLLGDIPPSPTQSLCLGCVARCTAGVLLIPVTVIKTRFESGEFAYKGVLQALGNLHKTEGFRGLTSGLLPTLLRDVPYSGLYLMFYSQLKNRSQNLQYHNLSPQSSHAVNQTEKKLAQSEIRTEQKPKESLVSPLQVKSQSSLQGLKNFGWSLVAGVLASLVTHPFDVIKTKVQVSKSQMKSGDAFFNILSAQGLGGLMTGLMPRLIRRTLMTALSWTLYESIFQYLNNLNK